MPAFSLSVFDVVTRRDYLNLAAGAIALRIPVYGLQAGDALVGAVFCAELPGQPDLTDNAATTVHRSLLRSDTGWEGMRSPGGFPSCVNLDFLLTAAEAALLTTPHDYDVRVYVSRLLPDGVTRTQVDRVVQYGTISVRAAITSAP